MVWREVALIEVFATGIEYFSAKISGGRLKIFRSVFCKWLVINEIFFWK